MHYEANVRHHGHDLRGLLGTGWKGRLGRARRQRGKRQPAQELDGARLRRQPQDRAGCGRGHREGRLWRVSAAGGKRHRLAQLVRRPQGGRPEGDRGQEEAAHLVHRLWRAPLLPGHGSHAWLAGGSRPCRHAGYDGLRGDAAPSRHLRALCQPQLLCHGV